MKKSSSLDRGFSQGELNVDKDLNWLLDSFWEPKERWGYQIVRGPHVILMNLDTEVEVSEAAVSYVSELVDYALRMKK